MTIELEKGATSAPIPFRFSIPRACNLAKVAKRNGSRFSDAIAAVVVRGSAYLAATCGRTLALVPAGINDDARASLASATRRNADRSPVVLPLEALEAARKAIPGAARTDYARAITVGQALPDGADHPVIGDVCTIERPLGAASHHERTMPLIDSDAVAFPNVARVAPDPAAIPDADRRTLRIDAALLHKLAQAIGSKGPVELTWNAAEPEHPIHVGALESSDGDTRRRPHLTRSDAFGALMPIGGPY